MVYEAQIEVDPSRPVGESTPKNAEGKRHPLFASFSLELPALRCLIGPDEKPRDQYIQLLRNLVVASHSDEVVLRLGGNSADSNCFGTTPRVPGCHSNITLDTLNMYKDVSIRARKAFDLPVFFVIGTNLGGIAETDGSSVEASEIRALVNASLLGSIVRAVEIGNEVDSYIATHPHAKMDTPFGFDKKYREYISAYRKAGLGDHKIQGGAFADVFRPDFDIYVLLDFLKEFEHDLYSLSIHNYPRIGCSFLPGHPKPIITTEMILSTYATSIQADLYAPFASAARAHDVPFVIGEANSVSCGGQENVSDTFAATLWGIDYLASMSKIGVEMINFHGSRSPYSPLYCPYNSSTHAQVEVKPLYYAQLVHGEIAPAVNTSWVHTSSSGLGANSVAHATVNTSSGHITVAIVMKSQSQPLTSTGTTNVTVSLKNWNSTCSKTGRKCIPSRVRLARLSVPLAHDTASRLAAKDGIEYAGMTFDKSRDGHPIGRRTEERLRALPGPGGSGLFVTFSTTQASAVVLFFECAAAAQGKVGSN